MISDKDLRDAARTCEKAILDNMPDPEDCPAEFSPAFERRMRRLIRRVDHPVCYWMARLLPLLLIVGAIAAVLLLPDGSSPEPPAPPVTPAPPEDPSAKPTVYRPTWLPEGCRCSHETLYDGEGMIVYTTPDGTEATFLYALDGELPEEQGEEVLIGGEHGLFCQGHGKGDLNDLYWTGEGVCFWLSAPFGEEDMVKIAESVEAGESAPGPG